MEIKTTKDLATYLTEKLRGMEKDYKFSLKLKNCLKELDIYYHSFLDRSTVDISYAGFPVCSLTLKCKRVDRGYRRYTFFVDSFTPAKKETERRN